MSAEQLRWALALSELAAVRSPWRLWKNPRSSYIWVRHTAAGIVVERFSLRPLKVASVPDIEQAVGWCLLAAQKGRWQGPRQASKRKAPAESWQDLAQAVSEQIVAAIPKEGSRTHLLNDLRFRIAKLPGRPNSKELASWAEQKNPLRERRTFNRRLEVLSWINRVVPDLGVEQVLQDLRLRRPRGAAQRLAAAQAQRVRLVPTDDQIEDWLDQLDPFNQWIFAAISTYGLRPHELWHCEAPDERGWVTIPGEMLTKSARAHFAPPVPARWLERYRLRDRWTAAQAELLRRWPIKWDNSHGVPIPVNNAALGQYLRKQFTLRGVKRLVTHLTDSEDTDWLRPYDLRHCYAIRCATSEECRRVDAEMQASWLGHSWEVHMRIYLKWLPASRMKRHQQNQLNHARDLSSTLDSSERQELELLREQIAAMQKLLGGNQGSQ